MPSHKNRLLNLTTRFKKERHIGECVYRLSYAGKHIIVKGKTLIGSLLLVEYNIKTYRWHLNRSAVLYRRFCRHIKLYPKSSFRCTILMESNNPLELLKCEQYYLDIGFHSGNCLNNNTHSYIPKQKEGGDYGWLPYLDVIKFKSYLMSPFRRKYKKLQPQGPATHD
jgi:hypothetical protein